LALVATGGDVRAQWQGDRLKDIPEQTFYWEGGMVGLGIGELSGYPVGVSRLSEPGLLLHPV